MAHRTVAAILILITTMILALPTKAQQNQKPFTQDQVQAKVRDGLADETGVKAIEQRGIDFAPAEEFLQSFKTRNALEGGADIVLYVGDPCEPFPGLPSFHAAVPHLTHQPVHTSGSNSFCGGTAILAVTVHGWDARATSK